MGAANFGGVVSISAGIVASSWGRGARLRLGGAGCYTHKEEMRNLINEYNRKWNIKPKSNENTSNSLNKRS